jgi:hypothetical protein
MPSDIFDRALLAALALFALLAVAHDWAGYAMYVKGEGMGPFPDDHWKPETPKQRALLGVFFTIPFAWWQSCALMAALLLLGNPLGPWLGVIGFGFTLPQFVLLLRFIPWDRPAVAVVGLYLLALLAWTAHAFSAA